MNEYNEKRIGGRFFHLLKNKQNPFIFATDTNEFEVSNIKMCIVVLYTILGKDYLKEGKVAISFNNNDKKIIFNEVKESGQPYTSKCLDCSVAVRVYVDKSTFKDLDLPEDYLNVYIKGTSAQDKLFVGFYSIRPIYEYDIKQGLYIVLSHYNVPLSKRVVF